VSANYTSEVMAQKYRKLYEEVLGRPTLATMPSRRLDDLSNNDHSNIDARGA
jgi:hypothetical protein